MAQSVERRLGKAEVGGSSPLGSFLKPLIFQGFYFFLFIFTDDILPYLSLRANDTDDV